MYKFQYFKLDCSLVFNHVWYFSSQGIEYLVEHEIVENVPESVAQFLFKGEGLNKTAIGDYLGERYASYSLT